MEVLLSALENPGNWTEGQWLSVSVALFIIGASGYFLFRLYRIARSLNKKPYRPNIGRARLRQALNRERERRSR